MFFKQYNQALPLLAVHYQQKFHFSEPEAKQKANLALMHVVLRAAGAMPLSAIESESALIGLLRGETSSLDDLQLALAHAGQDQEAKILAYSALKVALYKNKPIPWIAALLKFIGPLDENKLMAGDESALFAALHDRDYVTLLLNSGANVDYTNAFGKTALFYAVSYGDRELVQLLLAHGADVNHAYFSARQINPKNESCTLTATLKHTKRTPLMHAAQNSDVDMMKLLIDKGARTRDLDEMGFSALDYAVMGGNAKNQLYLAGLGVPLAKPAKE